MIQRRVFITLLGGAAAWPVAARAQQSVGVRRIGVLQSIAADDVEAQRRSTAFVQGLQQAGWTDGRNVRIEIRSARGGDAQLLRRYAAELLALAPDVVVCAGSGPLGSMLAATRTVPIAFTIVPDPVAQGSLTVSRAQAATQPASASSSMGSAENGWNCSRRSRRRLRESQCCANQHLLLLLLSSLHFRRWRRSCASISSH